MFGIIIVIAIVIAYKAYAIGLISNSPPVEVGDDRVEYTFSSRSDVPPKNFANYSEFQTLLEKYCMNQEPEKSAFGKIALDMLPLSFNMDGLPSFGGCNSGRDSYGNYISIALGNEEMVGYSTREFITISDSNSSHCCEGPSSIEPTGKLVETQGDIGVYIHTGHWGEGPNTNYKPIITRGIKTIKMQNGENLRIVLDRIAIAESDAALKLLEDKYRVVDPHYDSGKYVLTPDAVTKMLNDEFFNNFQQNSSVEKVIAELQSIKIKE